MNGDGRAEPGDREGLVGWLLREARHAGDIPDLADALCRNLLAHGVPLSRLALGLPLLHPLVRFVSVYWRRDRPEVEVVQRVHGTEQLDAYLSSPVAAVIEEGADAMRFPLERMSHPWRYAILEELRAQGVTDYAVMALRLSRGRRGMISFATDRPGGFATRDLALIDGTLDAMAAVVETLMLRRLAATVLDTYVGRRTGARILSGDIRRGTGADLRAVLWYCDLRGFSALSDRLSRVDLIALLNGYFEIMAGAVEARGGEILKFIGDAMLAILPLDGDSGAGEAGATALDAADDALARIAARNAERAAWGEPTLRCGIALHLGDVMYGNIGAPTRLDFTVIGPAVNLVNRIEGLNKRLGRAILTSAEFAAACPPHAARRLMSLGWHPVRGMVEPVEVYGLN